MNQAELAARLGIGHPHLSRVISGDVPAGNCYSDRSAARARPPPEERSEWLTRIEAAATRICHPQAVG